MSIIAVTSGKGGVGKTTVAAQVARAAAARGRRTVLVDASFSYGCADLHFGLSPLRDLSDVLQGSCTLGDALIEAEENLEVLPGATGSPDLADLGSELDARFTAVMEQLEATRQELVIDCSTGLHGSALSPLRMAERVLVVLTPDPAAVVGSYALIRALSVVRPGVEAEVVVNLAGSEREGADAHWRLRDALIEYHDTDATYLCSVPWDPAVRESVLLQSPLLAQQGTKDAAGAFGRLGCSLFGELLAGAVAGTNVVPFDRSTLDTSMAAQVARTYLSQE